MSWNEIPTPPCYYMKQFSEAKVLIVFENMYHLILLNAFTFFQTCFTKKMGCDPQSIIESFIFMCLVLAIAYLFLEVFIRC